MLPGFRRCGTSRGRAAGHGVAVRYRASNLRSGSGNASGDEYQCESGDRAVTRATRCGSAQSFARSGTGFDLESDDGTGCRAGLCGDQSGSTGGIGAGLVPGRSGNPDRHAARSDATGGGEQYVTDFRLVFQAREKLCQFLSGSADWETAVITLHVWMLSQWPDTLIARKCGGELASEATLRAKQLMQHGDDEGKGGLDPQKLAEFDAWLRADGHRRNPGTTADLVAATLFAALRDGLMTPPSREALRQAARRP